MSCRRIGFILALTVVGCVGCVDVRLKPPPSGSTVGGQGASPLDLDVPRTIPSGTRYYVSTSGSDLNNGATPARAWRTLNKALSATPCGSVVIVADGTYRETLSLGSRYACDSSSPLVVFAENERGATVQAGHDFLAPNTQWTLVGPDEYESTASCSGSLVWGYYQFQGQWIKLLPYKNLADLRSAQFHGYASPLYAGPGAICAGGKFRLRMTTPSVAVAAGIPSPPTLDPNLIPIQVSTASSVLALDGVTHLVWDGVNLMGADRAIQTYRSQHLIFKNLEIRGGRYHVILRDGTSHVQFDRIRIDNALPDYVFWTDVKADGARVLEHLQGSQIEIEASVHDIEMSRSDFLRGFDLSASGALIWNITLRDSLIDATFDDVFQLDNRSYNIQIFGNQFLRMAAIWGPHGYGPTDMAHRNRRWFYRNVVDFDHAQPFCRPNAGGGNACDSLGYTWAARRFRDYGVGSRTLSAQGLFVKRGFPESHGGPAEYWTGFKIYQNTFFAGRPMSDSHGGPLGSSAPRLEWAGEETSILNNIIVQNDDWATLAHYQTSLNTLINGNLYFTPNRTANTPLYRSMDGRNFFSPLLLNQYFPAWEGNSVVGDPLLDSRACPALSSLAAQGGVSLDPTLYQGSSSLFRGARDPRSTADCP